MALENVAHLTSFIAGLDLGEIQGVILEPRERTTLFADSSKDGKEAGYVDAGSLVSFASGVSGQSQADLLNSTLLAQLAANKKYDRDKETENWYKFYRQVLENVGWVVEDFEFQKGEISDSSATVDKIALQLLAAIAIGNEIAVVKKTFEAFKSLSSDHPKAKLFQSATHSEQNGNFQISIASETGEVVTTKIGAFYFSAKQTITNLLFFNLASAGAVIYQGSQTISLNKEIYGKVRKQIVDKLGDKAKNYIQDLDI